MSPLFPRLFLTIKIIAARLLSSIRLIARITAIRHVNTRFGKLPVLVILLAAGSLIAGTVLPMHLGTRSVSSNPPVNPAAAITVHAAGRGKPYLNLQDGRAMSIEYRGNRELAAALQSGATRARTLASADFDYNGTPDVIAGYAFNGGGMVTLQRGNPDAFAPTDDSVFVRLQQGYNPESLLPVADLYPVPVSVDFLVTGNFNNDSNRDVLLAAKGGGLYLMAGDGRGGLDAPQEIALPGAVTALAAGEFRAADGFADIAVGITGRGGDALLIFDDAARGFSNPLVQQPLAQPASAIEFGSLDGDPFMDVAVADASELFVVHGWGRKEDVSAESRVERIEVGPGIHGLTVGQFAWDRQGRSEIAALTDDGRVHIVQNAKLDTRPYDDLEAAKLTRVRLKPTRVVSRDMESVLSWRPSRAAGWTESSSFTASSFAGVSSASKPLLRTNLSRREMDDLMLLGESQPKLEVVRRMGPNDKARGELSFANHARSDLIRAILDTASAPVAVLALPPKLNGVSDMVVLSSNSVEPSIVANAPNTSITVDRFDDPSGASLAAASVCDANPNNCSLRGAFEFANNAANPGTTINLPAGTYVLSTNGTSQGGCDGNAVGDLGANQSTNIVGAGAATTIIRQTGTGPSNDGDRIMCMNEVFTVGLVYNFSAVTFVGGREGTAGGGGAVLGGAGIIGGELNNSLTLTNVVFANNQETVAGSANLGGGGLQITGGDLIITNSTFGGSSAPGAYTDRSSTNTANSQQGSGGGLTYTPSSPKHTGGSSTLTITGSTFSRNTSAGIGGGGADLLIFAFASPGGIGSGSASISTTTFSNNQAANGGGIIVESLPTTVATTSFTNNSASNRGGAIYVGGQSLLLDGTGAGVTMSGNTAPSGGTSISTAAIVNVSGTNVTLGGSIEMSTGGIWTNNVGSILSPTDVVITGGTFNMNNSTMNVGGNITFGPGAVVGATFNGDSGTVNIAGNLTTNSGGSGPVTTFNGGTGTFNFNGSGAQTISGTLSPTFFNLTDSNTTQPLAINNSISVSGSLNANGANTILAPAAASVISGTGTLTGTGTARVTRTAATPDFLSQYTISNKTLTNLTIDYSGAGNQTVNNTPAYGHLRISGTGTKTLQGATSITGNLTIAAAVLDVSASSFFFNLDGNWTNSVGASGFVPRAGTVTFDGSGVVQALSGNTTFFNLTLNNSSSTTQFGTTTTTIQNNLVTSAGSMQGDTSTIIFTGAAGSIGGANAKQFHNLQINSGANISNSAGGNTTILNDYTNNGAFTQAAGLTTTFASSLVDGNHSFSGNGSTAFGNVTINGSNTVDAGAHNISVVGTSFSVNGIFTGNTSNVTFSGNNNTQTIGGAGTRNFKNLTINHTGTGGVVVGANSAASGTLTLTSDLTTSGAVLDQTGGTSTGAADVIGTVRRTDLGVTERAFGNLSNTITINSGTPPTQLDFNLVKAAPGTFPSAVKVVPRDITLTPTGGSGISATVKLRYIDPGELAGPGITESRLVLWKNISGVWTPQGGAVNAAGNFVSLSGVSSFSEWAIAEGSDLTLSKANNVSGSAVTGQAWNWTLTASNSGSPATFTAGQTILSDNLPSSNLNYGAVTVQNVSNITGSANISCAITSNDLTCTANGGSVTFDSNLGASSFDVVFGATPQAAGTYQNPRSGGNAQIDPANAIAESAESNNSPTTNTVTVGKANTTTAITSDNPDPTVVGEAVTVQWNVAVSAPGSLGTPLTGNVTVSDGTDTCVAAVSAGQCNLTFTSPGVKNLTATYAGDSSYNGSASSPATAHTVNKADTTTTITSDNPDSSLPGQSVTVQWTVAVNSPGSGTPTGNVKVTVSGGAETCSATVATSQCSLVLNAGGTRTLTATYVGDTNFNTSSDTEDHQVCMSSLVTTNADSGAGSLRQIIADACDGTTITFDSAGTFSTPQTITLTSGEILIDKNLTIDAGSNQVTVSGNNASRVFHINSGMTARLVGLTIAGGSSASDGGAIINDGALTITSSTLSSNAASADGGALSTTATGTSLTLINTTISGNTAAGSGGGVIVLGGTVTSINSTITNNKADSDNNSLGNGGGIRVQAGTVTLNNTIVAGNFNEDGPTDADDDINGTIDPTSSYNLVGVDTGMAGIINGTLHNQVGTAATPVDPLLGALADNGGPIRTHALLAGSPALDAGSDTAATDASLATDQRGSIYNRFADSDDADTTPTVDIGAFEAQVTVQNIADQATNEDTQLQFNFNVSNGVGSGDVSATSSDTSIVPNPVVTGSGSPLTLTINPSANKFGTVTVTVTITLPTTHTMTDTFMLTVNPVADTPSVTNATAPEDTQTTSGLVISRNSADGAEVTHFKITNIQNGTLFQNDGATQINDGDFITFSQGNAGLKFRPAPNSVASGQFTVQAATGNMDAALGGGTVNASISVTSVNDAPVPADDLLSNLQEDVQRTIPFTDLIGNDSAGPADEAGQTLTVASVSDPVGGTVQISGTDVLFTPTQDFNGTASFKYKVQDNGTTNGNPDPQTSTTSANVSFNITAVNDPPSFTKGANQVVKEDAGPQNFLSWATNVSQGPGETGQTLTFNVSVTSTTGNLAFSSGPAIDSSGNLTYTTSPDTNGAATISVTLSDNGSNTAPNSNTSAAQTFTITVSAVNDAPSFQIPSNPPTVNEDTGLQSVNSFATNFRPGPTAATDEVGQALAANGYTVTQTGSTGNLTFSGAPSISNAGTLTYMPTANTSGTATFNVTARDNGGTADGGTDTSAPVSFTITVTGQNDAPVLDDTGSMSLTAVNEDTAPASNPGTLVSNIISSAGGDRITDVDAGAKEGIAVTAANSASGTWQFSIDNGTNWSTLGSPDALNARLLAADATTRLRFLPAPNFNGTVNPGLTVRAWDQTSGSNGGSADASVVGGTTAFSAQTELISITVNPVNDQPTANAQNVNTGEDTPVGVSLTGSDVETNSSNLTYTVTVQPTNGVLSGTVPNLTFTPNPNFFGPDSFKFTVTDTGDGLSPALTSTEATVSIMVAAINDAPINMVPGAQSTVRNSALAFSAANSNLISIADVDAGADAVQVTLIATNGRLTLSGTTGLGFTVGDGTSDTTMTFAGTITNINSALNGLVFDPLPGFDGAAAIQIETNDQGHTGSGGALNDTDTINLTVVTGGVLAFSAATYTVAEDGVTATITVTRTNGSNGTTNVDYATSNGTAIAGQDYTSTSGQLTFNNGETTKTFDVAIANDALNEAAETVNLTLSNVTGSGELGVPSTALLSITDNDSLTMQLSAATYTANEADLRVSFTVTRLGDTSQPARVDYATSDISGLTDCSQVTGNASERCDYATSVGTLRFASGEVSKSVAIPLVNDKYVDGPETFTLTLANPVGGELGPVPTALVTIADDDLGPPSPNPVDTDLFFLRQLYVDILGREPEPPGLAAWLSILNNCAVPTQCDRVEVASAFVRSPEFHDRGFFVYRFYAAALGRMPHYGEFIPDMARVSGFLSGQDLEANKQAYLQEFMARPEFKARYDGLGNTAFVETLLQGAGLPNQAGREGFIAGLNNGTLTRAQVLRQFIESTEVRARFVNESLVVMSYFGFLRRDPDILYQQWIETLNNSNDYRLIIHGFINSAEYRLRFGL